MVLKSQQNLVKIRDKGQKLKINLEGHRWQAVRNIVIANVVGVRVYLYREIHYHAEDVIKQK